MRSVSGLDRPVIQWTFVALGVVLIALTAAEAVAIRRVRARIEEARTAEMNARLDRQQLEIELVRERSAREALSIEVARLRGAATPGGAAPPTLTLTPLAKRGGTPPAPSVQAPAAGQVIELRLELPRQVATGLHGFTIAIRQWSSGETLWARGGLSAARNGGRPAVAALVTGDALAAGPYEILLSAVTPAGQPAEVATYEVTIAPAPR